MRAAVFHAAGSPLSIEKVPDPHPAAGEVLIEVVRAGICEACDERAHARPQERAMPATVPREILLSRAWRAPTLVP